MAKARRKNKPNILHHASRYMYGAVGISVGVVLIVGTFSFTALLAGPLLRSAQMAAVVSATLVDLTNQDREQNQLQGLTVNPELTVAAQAKADDMAQKGYFAHVSPEGLNSWYWFKQAGYSFTYAGENLAVDFTDSGAVNQAWLDSPTHRANIMNGHFTQIGIATAEGTYEGHPTIFVVQMFGTPTQAAADTSVRTVSSPGDATKIALATTEPAPQETASAPKTQVLGVETQTKTAPAPATKQAVQVSAASQASAQTAVPAPSLWSVVLRSPHMLLRTVYIVLAALLLVALIIRTEMEWHKRHLRHVFAAVALLVLMGGLAFAADHFVFVKPVLGAAQTQEAL